MANTRYTALVTQFKLDIGDTYGRSITTAIMDAYFTKALDWVLGLHPDKWPFTLVSLILGNGADATLTAADLQTQSITVLSGGSVASTWKWYNASGTAPVPRLNGTMSVKTKTSITGDWKPLGYRDWLTICQMKQFNRTALTTANRDTNQEFWSIKMARDAADTEANNYPTVTIELFPYSYSAANWYVSVDYVRESPTVASGSNADDAFIWALNSAATSTNLNFESALLYFAEMLAFYQIGNQDRMQTAWSMAQMFGEHILKSAGVPANRIHIGPPFVLRPIKISDNAE